MAEMEYSQYIAEYLKNGFVVIPNFLTNNEVEALKMEAVQLIDNMDISEHPPVSMNDHLTSGTKYLLESTDKLRFFYELSAIDSDGKLKLPKSQVINRIGHGCHMLAAAAKSVTFSSKVRALSKNLGFAEPLVTQGMYILKNSKVGEVVPPHQDETYLNTDPAGNVLGLWFALDDATVDNGCLQFIPGSHKSVPLTRFYIRTDRNTGPTLEYVGEADYLTKPDPDAYVSAPAQKGSCVLIHGLVVHRSAKNQSAKPRKCYAFHLYDRHNCAWSGRNWLQESDQLPFANLYSAV